MNTLLLKSLITEEVSKLINERPYAEEDIVDKNDIDFQGEYDKLNQLLFNGALPKVPLIWKKRSMALGHVFGIRDRYRGVTDIKYLAMSPFHAMPYRVFKDVLAHEMIHVKQLASGHPGGHGWDFLAEAERINRMGLGFKITVRSDEDLGVSDTVVNRKQLVGIIINRDGQYFISVTTPNIFNTEFQYVMSIFNGLVLAGKYRKVELTAVESKNPQLLRYGVSRSFRRKISYGALSDELLQQLLEDKILKNVIFETGKQMVVSESDNVLNETMMSEGGEEEIKPIDDNWEEVTII